MSHALLLANTVFWWTGALIYLFGGLTLTALACWQLLELSARYLGRVDKITRAWFYLETGRVPKDLMEKDGR